MKYSIDTSAILDGWVRYYPPDVIPALWDRLARLIDNGALIATEEVLYELEKKNDDAYKWAKSHDKMFMEIDEETQIAVSEILSNHKKLIGARKNRPMCDPFVIALAKVKNCKVITAEKPTNNPERPNIPDVCNALGISCISLLELCREQKWVFS